MITKIGNTLMEKEASLPLILGAISASAQARQLSPEQEKALKKHYDLSEDASLTGRSAGRGVLGGWLGAGLAAAPVGAIIGVKGLTKGRLRAGQGLALLGGSAGGYLAGRKYSPGAADELLKGKK